MTYLSLVDASKEVGVPEQRLVSMIHNGSLNGVLVTDGARVVSGMISDEELKSLTKENATR